jgi:hypothetical protein
MGYGVPVALLDTVESCIFDKAKDHDKYCG